MEEARLRCPFCAAELGDRGGGFCESCGKALPHAAGPVTPLAGRLEAARRHPELAALRTHQPAAGPSFAREWLGLFFGGLFLLLALSLLSRMGHLGGGFTFVPAVLVAAGLLAVGCAVLRILRSAGQPLERLVAAVVGKRAGPRRGLREDPHTEYFVTLEFPGATRREYETRGEVYGEVAEGDVGMAFLRAAFLLEFRRVRV